ncbi:DUF6541 family protein [Microbacterium marinilacus]|uniref:Uncharacterized protein n=1 Tax=Microbacterium marinilacus TaxID=415209 RepID=A0ABP7BIZ8_9MICO|nr:DUF6541 family protein [Microbacterium marinilacus]MBY0689578.1 hypothetical protein [Microbacterium marinilacus]
MAESIPAWLPALAPLAVFTALLYLPGGAALWLMGLRPAVALGYAPLLTTAYVGVVTAVCAALGLPFGAIPFAAGAAALVAVVAGIRLVRGRGRLRLARPRRVRWPWVLGALALNALVVGVAYVRHIPSAEAPVYQYDTIWHLTVIRWFLESGDYSSLDAGLVDGTAGGHFYPAAWHALVALTSELSGASIPAAVHGSLLALVLIAWPTAIAWLTRTLFGPSRVQWAAAAGLSFLPAVFPIGFLGYGVLYSNLFGYVLLPAALIAVVAMLRAVSGKASRMPLPALTAVVVAVPIAFVFAQPNTAFTLIVLALPFAVLTLDRLLCRAVARRGRGWLRPAGHAAFAAVFATAWVVIHDSPFLDRTTAVNWAGGAPSTDAAGEWFAFADLTKPQWLLLAFVLAGIVIAVRYGPSRWWLVSAAIGCLLYVVAAAGTATSSQSLRNYLVGFWYTDPRRLAATAAILLVPYLALAVATGVWALVRAWRRRSGPSRSPRTVAAYRRWGTAAAASVMMATLAFDATIGGLALGTRAAHIAEAAAATDAQWYSPAEAAFVSKAEGIVGHHRVANDPFDGSAMAYSLGDLDVYFTALPGNWMGTQTADQRLIRERLKDVATAPEVCEAAERAGIRYALVLHDGDRGVFQNGPHQFPGLAIADDTPGFELAAADGPLRLYAVTACA